MTSDTTTSPVTVSACTVVHADVAPKPSRATARSMQDVGLRYVCEAVKRAEVAGSWDLLVYRL